MHVAALGKILAPGAARRRRKWQPHTGIIAHPCYTQDLRLPLAKPIFTRILVYGDQLGLTADQLAHYRALLKPFRLYLYQQGAVYRQKFSELVGLLTDPNLMRSPNWTSVTAKADELYQLSQDMDHLYYQNMHDGSLILTDAQVQILTTIYQQEEGTNP